MRRTTAHQVGRQATQPTLGLGTLANMASQSSPTDHTRMAFGCLTIFVVQMGVTSYIEDTCSGISSSAVAVVITYRPYWAKIGRPRQAYI